MWTGSSPLDCTAGLWCLSCLQNNRNKEGTVYGEVYWEYFITSSLGQDKEFWVTRNKEELMRRGKEKNKIKPKNTAQRSPVPYSFPLKAFETLWKKYKEKKIFDEITIMGILFFLFLISTEGGKKDLLKWKSSWKTFLLSTRLLGNVLLSFSLAKQWGS
jgi:hypothetical protein